MALSAELAAASDMTPCRLADVTLCRLADVNRHDGGSKFF
jgi:hypothetical protein